MKRTILVDHPVAGAADEPIARGREAAVYPRLRPGVRAVLALVAGVVLLALGTAILCGAPYRDIVVTTDDGLTLAGWYAL